jgi:hypothetical protein
VIAFLVDQNFLQAAADEDGNRQSSIPEIKEAVVMAKKRMNMSQPVLLGITTQTPTTEESYSGDRPNPQPHRRRSDRGRR